MANVWHARKFVPAGWLQVIEDYRTVIEVSSRVYLIKIKCFNVVPP
jgi:hypothetical protein